MGKRQLSRFRIFLSIGIDMNCSNKAHDNTIIVDRVCLKHFRMSFIEKNDPSLF